MSKPVRIRLKRTYTIAPLSYGPFGPRYPEICDAQGNRFSVRGFTYSLKGAVSGFYLIGERGEKEISLGEARFFKICRKKRRK